MDRRDFIRLGSAATSALLLARRASAQEHGDHAAMHHAHMQMPEPSGRPELPVRATPAELRAHVPGSDQRAVFTPNGSTLPWKVVKGVKVGHLIAAPTQHEFAPGLSADCWGYNGSTPGPTIEGVQGDRVRIYVTNRLPEATTVHWHGMVLPNGMDGVAGLNQVAIPPGETYAYEFTLRDAGTYMYHPHYDEMTQIALGMGGMFIVHPKRAQGAVVMRDFALMLMEWRIPVGAKRPDPNEMTDFNVLTFNSKAFPSTQPLLMARNERVRIRFGNLGPMDHHPIHLHGLNFTMTATDGGYVPRSAQYPETTVLVPVGSTRVIEFAAPESGDWAMHCHMTHHTMMQMGHGLPPMVGVDTEKLDQRMQKLVPGHMSMGTRGMGGMGEMKMPIPANSLPMRGAYGPYGYIDMGGMFTLLKVRDDPHVEDEWYASPKNTVAARASDEQLAADGIDPQRPV